MLNNSLMAHILGLFSRNKKAGPPADAKPKSRKVLYKGRMYNLHPEQNIWAIDEATGEVYQAELRPVPEQENTFVVKQTPGHNYIPSSSRHKAVTHFKMIYRKTNINVI